MKSLVLLFILSFKLVTQVYSQSVDFTFTTVTYGGAYGPDHCLAVWVGDNQDNFIKTLLVNGNFPLYAWYLLEWRSFSANQFPDTIDAWAGASLAVHTSHSVTWDCTDTNGLEVSDGDYRIFVEFTEINGFGPHQPFPFQKGASVQSITFPDVSEFKNVNLTFKPAKENEIPYSRNIPPPAPVVSGPGEKDFCGKGGPTSAFFLLFWLGFLKRFRKSGKDREV